MTVEQLFDLLEALALARQIEKDAGVDGAAARRHDQAVEHAERHRRGDADAAPQRAEAGAGPQMRGDDPSSRERGCMKLQLFDDEFVAQAMEAVAAHARSRQLARQRKT